MELGATIKYIIRSKGLLQQKVAEECGYTCRQLSDMIHGRKIVKPQDIILLCTYLEVTPNELFGIQ